MFGFRNKRWTWWVDVVIGSFGFLDGPFGFASRHGGLGIGRIEWIKWILRGLSATFFTLREFGYILIGMYLKKRF